MFMQAAIMFPRHKGKETKGFNQIAMVLQVRVCFSNICGRCIHTTHLSDRLGYAMRV